MRNHLPEINPTSSCRHPVPHAIIHCYDGNSMMVPAARGKGQKIAKPVCTYCLICGNVDMGADEVSRAEGWSMAYREAAKFWQIRERLVELRDEIWPRNPYASLGRILWKMRKRLDDRTGASLRSSGPVDGVDSSFLTTKGWRARPANKRRTGRVNLFFGNFTGLSGCRFQTL